MKTELESALQELKELPYRVLLVEDDADLRVLLERILCADHACVKIDWAASAEAAMKIIESAIDISTRPPFDLIVVDNFLEGTVSGLDFWRLCQVTFPRIPVVMTSSMSANKFFRSVGEGSIAPPFLSKPFSLLECREMFESVNAVGF